MSEAGDGATSGSPTRDATPVSRRSVAVGPLDPGGLAVDVRRAATGLPFVQLRVYGVFVTLTSGSAQELATALDEAAREVRMLTQDWVQDRQSGPRIELP